MALNLILQLIENFYNPTLASGMPLESRADNKHFRISTPFLSVYLLHTFRNTIHFFSIFNLIKNVAIPEYLNFIYKEKPSYS